MTEYLLLPFGQIDLTSLNEDYNAVIKLNENEIRIDINFGKTTIEKAEMDNIKNFLESIDKFDKQNLGFIDKDFNDENGDTVKEYIDFHIEELEKENLEILIDYNNKEIIPEKQLLNKLTLERVGLYPDGQYDEYFAVFDYTFKGNVYNDGRRTITDQMIVVRTDNKGNLEFLTCES